MPTCVSLLGCEHDDGIPAIIRRLRILSPSRTSWGKRELHLQLGQLYAERGSAQLDLYITGLFIVSCRGLWRQAQPTSRCSSSSLDLDRLVGSYVRTHTRIHFSFGCCFAGDCLSFCSCGSETLTVCRYFLLPALPSASHCLGACCIVLQSSATFPLSFFFMTCT